MKGTGIKNGVAVTIIVLLAVCSYTPSDTSNIKEAIDKILVEKTARAGYYISASRQAEEEGYVEIAVYLSELAEEEIGHLKKLSVLQTITRRDSKRNITRIIKMEKNAWRRSYPAIIKSARKQGKEEVAGLFEKMARDEERHYLGLKGLLKKVK